MVSPYHILGHAAQPHYAGVECVQDLGVGDGGVVDVDGHPPPGDGLGGQTVEGHQGPASRGLVPAQVTQQTQVTVVRRVVLVTEPDK